MPADSDLPSEQRWLERVVVRLSEVREDDGRLHRIGCAWQQVATGPVTATLVADLVDTATDQAVTDAAIPVNLDRARAAAGRRERRLAARTPAGALRRLYARCSARSQLAVLLLASLGIGWLVPFAIYTLLWCVDGIDPGPVMFWVVFGVLAVTSAAVDLEGLFALDPPALPRGVEDCDPADPLVSGVWPSITAVFAAYLPNEVATIVDSVGAALAQDYPGELQVVVAYNGADATTKVVERRLRALAASDARLEIVGVPGSTSKAQNINAAVRLAGGDVVGVFDADHCPAPGSFVRAARWIGGGRADVVQGHCVVRNVDESWLTRTVAVEFEGIYAVAHPGRSLLHGFGIFGGSNGYWRADLLRRVRMRPWMLTEDIDSSIRAVLSGATIVSDPALVSRELAPVTPKALWHQRMRWAQGWAQVSRRYFWSFTTTPGLTPRQRIGGVFLLGWREVYPWLSMQMFPVLAYDVLIRHNHHIHWLLPFFVFSGTFTTAVGPVQALFAWRLAVPEIRRRPDLFLRYLVLTGAVYGEIRSAANRCAHLREWLGDVAWRVTPRGVTDVALEETRASDDAASGERLGRS
jgi:hypothetical protein